MKIQAKIEDKFPQFVKTILTRIQSSKLGYRLARGTFWTLLGAILSRLFMLISSIVVARILGKTSFGELGIIQSTVGMFGTVAGFGMGMTATKFIAEFRGTDPIKAGRIRGLSSAFSWVSSGATACAMFIFAPWLAENTLAAPQLTGLLRIGSILLFFTAINGAQTGALAGFEAFKPVAKINLWCGLANLPLMIGGVYFGGINGAVWGMVLSIILNWSLNHHAIRIECKKAGVPYTYNGIWYERDILLKFSVPAVISASFFAPTEWIVNAILVNEPDGYGQMGLFNATKQWHVLILYIPMTISNLTFPILSNLLGEKEDRQYQKMIFLNFCLITGLAFITALPVSICSKIIMSLYGNEFVDGNIVLLIVCAYSILWAANIVIGQVLWSAGLAKTAMILGAIRAGILIFSFTILTSKNAYGLALAYLITYSSMTVYQGIISVITVRKITKNRVKSI